MSTHIEPCSRGAVASREAGTKRIATGVALLLLCVAGSANASSETSSRNYVIGTFGQGPLSPSCSPETQIGGACFPVPPGATGVDLTVVDDLAGARSGIVRYQFRPDFSTPEPPPDDVYIAFCNGHFSGDVPEGVETVYVGVGESDIGPFTVGGVDCSDDASQSFAVAGTITATFT